MILVADGGSTKVDWVALKDQKEIFRIQTVGLNPDVLSSEEIENHLVRCSEFSCVNLEIKNIYFYGAGCGTSKSVDVLKKTFSNFFKNAKIFIAEDMLGAVYACTAKPAIVAILGTGSNACYFDGKNITTSTSSLGYSIMDDASGSYFGKQLLRDYFYKQMPDYIAEKFESNFNLTPDFIKKNLYQEPNPNRYLASLASFMTEFKDDLYIQEMVLKGFNDFFKFWILPLRKNDDIPIYFVGSIAYFFRDVLGSVAVQYHLTICNVIQRPIDNLVNYHMQQALKK